MRFVEEEHDFWFFEIADFGQVLEEFGQHPQQKRRIKLGRVISLSAARMLTTPRPRARLHQIVYIEHGSPKNCRRPADRVPFARWIAPMTGRGNVAILGGKLSSRSRRRTERWREDLRDPGATDRYHPRS